MSPEKTLSLEEMVAEDDKKTQAKKVAAEKEAASQTGVNLDQGSELEASSLPAAGDVSAAKVVLEELAEPEDTSLPDKGEVATGGANLDEGEIPEIPTEVQGEGKLKSSVVLDEGTVPILEDGPDTKPAPKPKTLLDEGDAPELGDAPAPKAAPAKKVSPDEAMPAATSGKVIKDKISGVFSTQTVAKVGTGTTVRKTIQKAYWFAEELSGDDEGISVVLVQPLNNNNVPSGPKEQVPVNDFLERFNPELEFYQQEVFPKMRELDQTVKRAEQQRDQGALYSAEFEFAAALAFDEANVRANFGLGLTYMERGEPEKAGDIFERVVHLDAAFAPEHKHLFNEFGINLRKSKLHDQAVEYYTRALEITDNDENLYYNIARAYYERGDREECIESLNKALSIRPDFEEVKKFLEYLEKNAE